MRRLISSFIGLALSAAAPPGLAAQWGVSAAVGVARFGGTSRDSTGAHVGPYRPTTLGVRLDREFRAVRIALGALYGRTGLAGEKKDVAVVDYDAASFVELAPEVSLPLARFGAGVVIRADGGPAIDFWHLDRDGDSRTRLGARAGLTLEWPMSSRLMGSLSATGVLSGSIMRADEVPAGVERRATRRGGVSIGLRSRL